MSDKNRSIAFSIRFKNRIFIERIINYFNTIVVNNDDKQFDEISYTITDKSTFNWKQKSKSLKYSSKNLEKFYTILNELSDKKVSITFELLKLLDDWRYKSVDLDFSVSYKELGEEVPFSLNIILDFDKHKKVLSFNEVPFFKDIIQFLDTEKADIVYGFVNVIEKNKLPSFYIEGILSDGLNRKEEDFLTIWANKKDECSYYIWDLFLGNIISKKHIKKDTFKSIEKILIPNQIMQLSPNLFFITLNNGENIVNKSLKKRLKPYFKTLV